MASVHRDIGFLLNGRQQLPCRVAYARAAYGSATRRHECPLAIALSWRLSAVPNIHSSMYSLYLQWPHYIGLREFFFIQAFFHFFIYVYTASVWRASIVAYNLSLISIIYAVHGRQRRVFIGTERCATLSCPNIHNCASIQSLNVDAVSVFRPTPYHRII